MSNKLFLITLLFIFLLENSVTAQQKDHYQSFSCRNRVKIGKELIFASQNPKSMDTLNILCDMEKDLLKYKGKTIRFFLESMPIKYNRYDYFWMESPDDYISLGYIGGISIQIYIDHPYKNPRFFDWDTFKLNFELIKDEIINDIFIYP